MLKSTSTTTSDITFDFDCKQGTTAETSSNVFDWSQGTVSGSDEEFEFMIGLFPCHGYIYPYYYPAPSTYSTYFSQFTYQGLVTEKYPSTTKNALTSVVAGAPYFRFTIKFS